MEKRAKEAKPQPQNSVKPLQNSQDVPVVSSIAQRNILNATLQLLN